MKIKWRQYEMSLVTVIAVITLLLALGDMLFGSGSIEEKALRYSNLIWLQLILTITQFGTYVILNRVVIPKLYPLTSSSIQKMIIRYGGTMLLIIALIYVNGPVCNFISLFLTERYTDREAFNFINSFLPLHPQPLRNTFGGMGIAAYFFFIYLFYGILREAVIHFLERNEGRKKYRILLSNQIGIIACIYGFVILALFASSYHVSLGESTGVIYFIGIPVTVAVMMYEIYVLFPLRSNPAVPKSKFVVRLLIVTGIGAFAAVFLQRAQFVGRIPFFFGGWIFHLCITSPIAWAIYSQRKDRILELRGIEEALSKSKADLQFLRSQINPHFLFNSLNTLYGTAIEEGSKRTATGIQMLGDMMRFMLHDNHLEKIPLRKEIEYMKNFISLQKLRIQSSNQITIETNLSNDCDHDIGPMLLIPLVENAFKHGISLRHPSWIKIELICDPTMLQFVVRNSIHVSSTNDPEKESSGVGLVNVEERLKLLYPTAHSFRAIGSRDEFVATLNIYMSDKKITHAS